VEEIESVMSPQKTAESVRFKLCQLLARIRIEMQMILLPGFLGIIRLPKNCRLGTNFAATFVDSFAG